MEAALALRSLERSVEEVLLPTFDELVEPLRRRQRAVGVRRPLGRRLAAPGAAALAAADAQRQRARGRRNARRARSRRARRTSAGALPRARGRARAESSRHGRGRPRRRARGASARRSSSSRAGTCPTTTSRAGRIRRAAPRVRCRSCSSAAPPLRERARHVREDCPTAPFEAHRLALGALDETPLQKETRFQAGARRVTAARRVGT